MTDAEAADAARPDLSADYFALFDQPRAFAIDEGALAAHYRALQGATHPDRFASASAAERRWSVQASSFVNDAFETLRVPLKRAIYLLSLEGVTTDDEADTAMEPMFLMQQMEWREALESAPGADDPHAALDAVERDLDTARKQTSGEFDRLSQASDWSGARAAVRRWQFLEKLGREADELGARLDDD